MNETTRRETNLRLLTHRIADARSLASEQMIQRDAAIRQYGLAHPRSIAATRKLNWTQSSQRSLVRMHTASASHHARLQIQERT